MSKLLRFSLCLTAYSTLVSAADLQPPALRLGREIQPEHISLDLTLQPKEAEFSGKVEMEIQVKQAVDHFWLNATDLTVSEAKFTASGKTLPATIVPGGEQFVGFQFGAPLPTGKAHLSIAYKGKVNLRSSAGIFLSSRNADKYLFTQFEATDARSAFPCFDEPSFKIPWQLTLHVPQDDSAVSNTKIVSEKPEGNGLKVVRFGETKPLPSYLVAFGIGPFEFVDAGTAGSKHVPVRIVVPRGDAERAKYAASVTAEILTRLENYYGIPFPYEKSDQLAVPLSFGGAMENPGLVTYDENIVISPPGQDTVRRQRTYAEVAAHELAHQWTGDLVTMAWWNDTWLNESFATWMAARLISEWKPDWQARADDEAARLYAIDADTKISARRINQPAESMSDIGNAFDGITYQKGGSVLATFENAVGADKFQRVMHDYLEAHKFGNASSEDFLQQLGKGTKPEYAAAFATFLNQTGVPHLKMRMDCKPGANASVQVEQDRLLPVGSSGDAGRTWGVPVCISYAADGKRQESCQLFSQQTGAIALGGKGCPAWFLGNAKEIGYYEVTYEPQALTNLLDHRAELTLAEQVGLLGDLHLLSQAGKIPWDQTLALVPKLRNNWTPEIVTAAIRLAAVPRLYLDPADEDKYAAYVREMFGSKAREYGWKKKPEDSPADLLLRPQLVGFVARRGKDPQLIAEAKTLAEEWLKDRTVLSADIAGTVLSVAAQNSGPEFYAELLEAAKAENDPYLKPMMVSALGYFSDPALMQRTIDIVFNSGFDMRVGMRAMTGDDPVYAALGYKYLREHYDEIIAKMPNAVSSGMASRFPSAAVVASCSNAAADEAKTFFGERMKKVIGGDRSLEIAVEQIHLCAAEKPAASAEIAKFLQTYNAATKAAGGL